MAVKGGKASASGWAARVKLLGTVAAFVATALILLVILGWIHVPRQGLIASGPSLPQPDVPPLEFVYLDANRVDSYLGQLEDGLSKSELRTAQQNENVGASLTGGPVAQYSISQSEQNGTQETVTATSADRFYYLLRLLREGTLPQCAQGHGAGAARWHWMVGASDSPKSSEATVNAVECGGVGTFLRLSNVQLFLPPFASVLPSAQSVTSLFGAAPWRRFSFTSPTQSTTPTEIRRYVRAVGPSPRMPFIGAPFGDPSPVGAGLNRVTFFFPIAYRSLTFEPSLLSGPVNVVGKIVAFSVQRKRAYIDYPTISEFGSALLRQPYRFDNALGVCATAPPPTILSTPTKRTRTVTHAAKPSAARGPDTCSSSQSVLTAIKRSVTLPEPYVVVLPLAIYQ